jgi:chromosome segregation ATPase
MSMMEEFLELQEKLARLEKNITQKDAEITEKDTKILELTEKINVLTNDSMKNASDVRHFRSMVSVLETDKKNLERERDRLLKENEALGSQVKQFANMVETINQTLQTKEESLLSKEKQLLKKDELISEKDTKIEDYRLQFNQLSEDKERYQKEKFDFMEKINKEKIELVEKVGQLEKTIQADAQKMKTTKEKARDAQEGLLGATMEIEKLNENLAKITQKNQEITKELEEVKVKTGSIPAETSQPSEIQAGADAIKEELHTYKQKNAELEAHLEDTLKKYNELKESAQKEQSAPKPAQEEDVFGKGTGIYKSISALIAHFKLKLGGVQRTLRIVCPDFNDINKHALMDSLKNLPPQILKNIGGSIDQSRDVHLIEELKMKNWKLTDIPACNIFAMAVDTNEAALAVYDKNADTITGIFSNNEELVKLLNQAIMNPFIRGIKLN